MPPLDRLQDLSTAVLSPTALAAQSDKFALYRGERMKIPLEDVVDVMKRNIRILPVNRTDSRLGALAVEFSYADPRIEQAVTQELVSRFIEGNLRLGGLTLEVLDPASRPQEPADRSRGWIAAAGLAGGALIGLIVAQTRRRLPMAAPQA